MKTREKKMLAFYRGMDEDDRHALLRYAAFLFHQNGEREHVVEPSMITATADESVIGALKRLSASYPMLDNAKLLDQTSNLMSDHVLRGRDKVEVIGEFELLFDERYQKLKRERETND